MKLLLTLVAACLLSVCLPSASGRTTSPREVDRDPKMAMSDERDAQQESITCLIIGTKEYCYSKQAVNDIITLVQVTDLKLDDSEGTVMNASLDQED